MFVYTYSAMLSAVESDLTGHLNSTVKVINLSSVMKESHFVSQVEDFFAEKGEGLLVVNSDLLYDSRDRINMCRCHINNARLEKPSSAPKHVCFIVRVDQTRVSEYQPLSFGRNWRQAMVEILNGKGDTTISVEDLF